MDGLCERPTHNVAIKIINVTPYHLAMLILSILPGTVQMKIVTQYYHTIHQCIFAITYCPAGALEMREWKMQQQTAGVENAGVETPQKHKSPTNPQKIPKHPKTHLAYSYISASAVCSRCDQQQRLRGWW